jgi:hypothetical protein
MASHLIIPTHIAIYALLSSYCLCGGVMEHSSIFRSWLHVPDPATLKAVQGVSGYDALYTYLLPKAALTARRGSSTP